ncbi:MAG: TonB family protein [Bacteroidota bacterium]
METLFEFLIKASAGIALFYLVYWVFLRQETFHAANRWYLLSALLLSVLLPLFPVHYAVMIEAPERTTVFQAMEETFKNARSVSGYSVENSASLTWQQIVLAIYLTGVFLFFMRLLGQTMLLIRLILKHKIKSMNGIRIVENEKYGLPFSFFNIVFINPKFHKQEELLEILAHEKVHIRENHWFDLLITELLTVIFWFNPFIWFFEHSIKQNHEYLADNGVLAQGHSTGRYQALLVNQLMGFQVFGVTNNLNFALNKNRLKMMTKKRTPRVLGIKFVWALPALALLLFAFAEPRYKVVSTETENPTSPKQISDNEHVIRGKVIRQKNEKPLQNATVIIKGTTVGTITDEKGEFLLTNPNPETEPESGELITELEISNVGYETIVGQVGLTAKGSVEETYSITGFTGKSNSVYPSVENSSYVFRIREGDVSQEKKQIKGKVVNENGEPIHGVSIVIKGTTNGTVSNEDGEFELSASDDQQVVFSYVGKETVEVEVSSFNPAGKQEITLNEGVFQIIPEKHFGDEMPPPPPPPLPSKDNGEEVFFVVEDIPQYPDGFYALGQYVEEMQNEVAKSDNIKGKAVVGFTVSETGKVTNIKIVEQDNEEVGKAAATIATNMKDWTPGKQRGKPVSVKMTMPVEF